MSLRTHTHPRFSFALQLAGVSAALVVAACGGDEDERTPAGAFSGEGSAGAAGGTAGAGGLAQGGKSGAAAQGGASVGGGAGAPGGSGGAMAGGRSGGPAGGAGGAACEEGKACTDPAFVCKEAAFVCGSGAPTCEPTGNDLPNGQSCGTGKSCFNGACTACQAGAACEGPNACKKATIACGTGEPICEESGGNAVDGTACGAGLFCRAGACSACSEGATCALPESPCKKATTSCATGVSVCKATSGNVENGTACGAGKVCGNGACVTCSEGAACASTEDPCHVGTITCGSGKMVCTQTGANAAAGMPCGTGLACDGNGVCVKKIDAVLAVVSGDKQSAMINQELAIVTLKLTGPGGVPLASTPVTCKPVGLGFVAAQIENTDSQGRAFFRFRNGRPIGAYSFSCTAAGGAMVTVTSTATEPPAGTLVPLVNAGGLGKATEPGRMALDTNFGGTIYSAAAAADGTLYFGTGRQVWALAPDSELRVVAGVPSCGAPEGDGGPALAACLNFALQLALDPSGSRLFMAHPKASGDLLLVRAVDLVTGMIDRLGGDGSVGAPSYGDGGPFGIAQLRTSAGDRGMTVGKTGVLYFADSSLRSIRMYDDGSGLITPWLVNPTPIGTGTYDGSLTVAPVFTSSGDAFFATTDSGSGNHRIVRRQGSTLSYVTGGGKPESVVDGAAAAVRVNHHKDLALAPGDNVVALTDGGNDTGTGVYLLRTASAQVKRIAGDFGAWPSAVDGNFGPALAGRLQTDRLAVDAAGHVYLVEYGGQIRMVWKGAALN